MQPRQGRRLHLPERKRQQVGRRAAAAFHLAPHREAAAAQLLRQLAAERVPAGDQNLVGPQSRRLLVLGGGSARRKQRCEFHDTKLQEPGRDSRLSCNVASWRLMRGSRMPCWAYAYWISPEQSNPLSWVPPHTYGVPSDSIAVWTTSPALPLKVVGGSGGGSSGGALYPPLPRPPSPLPNPMETPMAALTPPCAALLGRPNPRGPRSPTPQPAPQPNANQQHRPHPRTPPM